MPRSLSGRHFLKLLDFTTDEIRYLVDLSKELKKLKMAGVPHRWLEGKNIVLLFEKTSTRTRCSFEVAGMDLGMGVTYLDPGSSQMGKKESIEDTARVLGRMYDGIEYRGFAQSICEELAANAGVPVWNGLTDDYHPTQILADFLTMKEQFGYLKGLNFVYLGDGRNNMANSLIVGGIKTGMKVAIACPKDYQPDAEIMKWASENGDFLCTDNILEAAAGSDVLYTDVWASMGQEGEAEERKKIFKDYQINDSVVAVSNEGVMVLHCLPAHREEEITAKVFEEHANEIFDEAENRLHAQKAVLVKCMVD